MLNEKEQKLFRKFIHWKQLNIFYSSERKSYWEDFPSIESPEEEGGIFYHN